MRFDDNRVDTSGLEDRRGSRVPGGAMGAGVGGMGLLGIVGLVIWMLMGGQGDPSAMLSGGTASGTSQTQQSSGNLAAECATSQAIDQRDDCFVLQVYNGPTRVWGSYYGAQGQRYRPPKAGLLRPCHHHRRVRQRFGQCRAVLLPGGPEGLHRSELPQATAGAVRVLRAVRDRLHRRPRGRPPHPDHHRHRVAKYGSCSSAIRARQSVQCRAGLQADCLAGVWGRKANDAGNVVISQTEYGGRSTPPRRSATTRSWRCGTAGEPESSPTAAPPSASSRSGGASQSGDPAVCTFG